MQVTLTIPNKVAVKFSPHSKGGYSKFSKWACENGTLPRPPTRVSAACWRRWPDRPRRKSSWPWAFPELRPHRAAVEKNRTTGRLARTQEWQRYEYLEHVVRIAKARAIVKLNAQ